ncbi:TEA-domain-containing protein, partial [Backusella circina FSU 941]
MPTNVISNNVKDKEEQVWPPDVESAFIEALESIPKLGRRKILVNGKPCGRNELISDFIFRKTGKIRTRKQVSSHIQVLKNTRKDDSHFMRLLTDSIDIDDNRTNQKSKPNMRQQQLQQQLHSTMHRNSIKGALNSRGAVKMKQRRSTDSLSSDESSINSSPSPTDYVLDIMYGDPSQQQALSSMLQFKDFYDPFQQSLFGMSNDLNAAMSSSVMDPMFTSTPVPEASIYTDVLPPDNNFNSLILSTSSHPLESSMMQDMYPMSNNSNNSSMNESESFNNETSPLPLVPTKKTPYPLKSETLALWPNYICLYLEYTLPYDPTRPLSHNLSQLPHCYPNGLGLVNDMMMMISKQKCPPIPDILAKYASVVLLAKTRLDLNLNISDFVFNNTSFFETKERRTIECTTTIYSFGNVVLESKEVQQALWVNEGKFMYSFVFVNQFFDAFMKGIRSLQSWEEVNIAINNLCIIQTFEDVETKYNVDGSKVSGSAELNTVEHNASSPLLCMIYEFERGQGIIEISSIGDN